MKTHIVLTIILLINFLLISCVSKTQNPEVKTQSSYEENLIKANKGLLEMDKGRIENYIKRRNWNMQITQSGLWYFIYDKKEGAKAKVGNIVTLKYQLELLDGTICYNSDSLGNKTFKLGQGGVESGLEQAVLMMAEGEKAFFILPPYMAHGLLGDENRIPSRAVIVYLVELLKIEK